MQRSLPMSAYPWGRRCTPMVLALQFILLSVTVLATPANGAVEGGPLPVATAHDLDEATLLSCTVTTSWTYARPALAIQSINGALAPGPQLTCDFTAPEMYVGLSSFHGRNVALAQALETLTPSGYVWTLHHRHLVLALRHPQEPLPPTPKGARHRPREMVPVARTLASLAVALRAWVRKPIMPSAMQVFGADYSINGDGYPPIQALAHEPWVVKELAPRLAIQLQGPEAFTSGASYLAAALGLTELAAVERTRLAALPPAVTEITINGLGYDMECEILRTLLAMGLGGARDAASVPLLATIADSPVTGLKTMVGECICMNDWGFEEKTRDLALIPIDERVAAIEALGAIGDRRARAALVRVLDDPRPGVLSWVAARALARMGAAGAAAHIERAFVRECQPTAIDRWEPDGDGALTVLARALCQVSGADGVREVIAACDAHPEVRWSMLQGLTEVRDPSLAPALLTRISRNPQYLESSPSGLGYHVWDRNVNLALTAQSNADEACIEQLGQLPPESEATKQILSYLGSTHTDLATAALVRWIHAHHSPQVRLAAIQGLGATLQPAAGEMLLNVIRNDPDPEVRCKAIESIGRTVWLAGEEDTPFVTHALAILDHALCADSSPAVREAAADVHRWETPDEIAAVHLLSQRLLIDPDASVQHFLAARLWSCARNWLVYHSEVCDNASMRHEMLAALKLAPASAKAEKFYSRLLATFYPSANMAIESRLAKLVTQAPDRGLAGLAFVTAALDRMP